jgi:hypothetical protein
MFKIQMTQTGMTRNSPPLVGGDDGEGELDFIHPHPPLSHRGSGGYSVTLKI